MDYIYFLRVPPYLISKSFCQGFGPVARLVGQIRAYIARQGVLQIGRVIGGEAKTDDATPVGGDLEQFNVHLGEEKQRHCENQ